MCLVVDKSRHNRRSSSHNSLKVVTEAFVADRPLVIKKLVRIHKTGLNRFQYRSPYFDTIVKMKYPYECFMAVHDNDSYRTSVERGFHAYLMTANVVDWHMRPTLTRHNIETIYGVIPVGAKYYIGLNKEVVSDKVMYFETLQEIADYFNVEKLADPYVGEYTSPDKSITF